MLRIHNGESLFNKWCWENWISTYKRMKLDPYFTPYKKINSKWIKDLNVISETIKLKENTGGKFLDIGLGNAILDLTPEVKATNAEINKYDFIKLKSSIK